MQKRRMEQAWEDAKLRELLHKSAAKEQIPESLLPEQMEIWLRKQTEGKEEPMKKQEYLKEQEVMQEQKSMQEQETGQEQKSMQEQETGQEQKSMQEQESGQEGKKHRSYKGWWWGTLGAAACLALILFAAGRNMDWELGGRSAERGAGADTASEADLDASAEDAASAGEEAVPDAAETKEGTTYEKLYQSFAKVWKEQEQLYRQEQELYSRGGKSFAETEEAADASADEETAAADVANDTAASTEQSTEMKTEDYGKTNQQEEAVEEADIIKNDGRYLYQVVYQQKDSKNAVKIVDTKDGLKEAACVGSFDNIQEIYIWEDKLVVLEPGWAEERKENAEEMEEGSQQAGEANGILRTIKETAEKLFTSEDIACVDVAAGYAYCRIHIYDISDRSNPEEYHTFTVKGSYLNSRISDGYLYFFTSCDTSRPESKDDFPKYIPMLEGKPMAEDKICLPKETGAASYLVMASVDMERPDSFVDSCALVTAADKFYVSADNIYVAETRYAEYGKEGQSTDSTRLFRYSYKDGRMRKEAEGEVKGTLRDDMSMNEYQGHLRLVTTVEAQVVEKVTDDLSGEVIGYDTVNQEDTNSLYVLDQKLKVTGKIENLAKDERIYSARFMGAAGYFVTFRETDPLFSVDLSNPAKPKILGELKVSGFSEYLHFYADNLLLGIGMEADEETGGTEGMKLSMFDISDPADVKEQSKLNLSEYDYSEALYDYKAVLIDTEKNLFGFSAEGYSETYERVYLLFSYENGEFQQIMKIDCSDDERYSWQLRGTYIGDRFFLLTENGRVEEYSLADGSKTRELEP